VRVYQVPAQSERRARGAPLSGHVCLEVTDDGVGMDAETARRIFEPFFTTKPPGKGTGLGLATVHGIIKQWGAHVEVESQPGKGTRFSIFCAAAERSLVATPSAPSELAAGGRETLLICEDDPGVRSLTATFLSSAGYGVLVADSGREALKLAAAERGLALLVTDVVMPEMNGVELARQLREFRPGTKVLYLSGYTASVIDSRTDLGANDELLAKPFTRAQLLQRVRRILDRPDRAHDGQARAGEK